MTFINKLLTLSLFLFISSAGYADSRIPFTLPDPKNIARIRSAELITDKGSIYFELYPESAPWHVANFKYLADTGYYKGKIFHLYKKDYIIQAGASSSSPNSGPHYTLPPEFNTYSHQFGTLGMARKMDLVNSQRRSHSSQFHILLNDAKHMDGSFTIFGHLISGKETLSSLKKGDRILDLKVYLEPID